MKKRRLTATLLAAACTLSAVPALSVSAVTPIPEIPAWVPSTAESAVDFLNTCGTTYYEDDVFCIVLEIPKNQTDDSDVQPDVKSDHNGTDYKILVDDNTGTEYKILFDDIVKAQFVTEEPVMPKNGSKTLMNDYQEQLKAYEAYKRNLELYGEDIFKNTSDYYVFAVKMKSKGDLNVDVIKTTHHYAIDYSSDPNTPPNTTYMVDADVISTYSFSWDGSNVRETDIYGWLPDCTKEFDDYLNKNSAISVHEGDECDQVVICANVNYSTGAELFIGQNGVPMKQVSNEHISRHVLLPILVAGETSRILQIYEPEKEGRTDFVVGIGRMFDTSPFELSRSVFTAQKDSEGHTRLTSSTGIRCDLNGDGVPDVADLVILTKFLSGQQDLTEAQFFIADVNEDKHVDAKDLAAIKNVWLSDLLPKDPVKPNPIIEDPTDPIVIIDPTDPIVIDDPTDPIVIIDPTNPIVIDDPTDPIKPFDPNDPIVIDDPIVKPVTE